MSKVRAVIYGRVSKPNAKTIDSDQPADKQYIENQIPVLVEYAKLRDIEVVEIITEKISTRKKNRPGYERVLTLARKRKIDMVLVWKFDRFARTTIELLLSLDEIHSLNMDFISYEDSIDTTTPIGKAMFGMQAVFAEFERSTMGLRISAGLARVKREQERTGKIATRSGKPIGKPPIPEAKIRNVEFLLDKGVADKEIRARLKVGKTKFYEIKKEWQLEKLSKTAVG